MSYAEAMASSRRCTVAGQLPNGQACSLVMIEESDGEILIYPHGVDRDAVLISPRAQQVLAKWLLHRESTRQPS